MRLCVDFYKKILTSSCKPGHGIFLETVTPSVQTSSECSPLQSRAGVSPDRALLARPVGSPDPQSLD